MRVTPDARSYARTVAAGTPHEDQIARAFHDGILHERAKAKRLERLAERNTAAGEPQQPALLSIASVVARGGAR